MFKSELAARLATSLSISPSMANAIITQLSEIIIEEVHRGGEVTIAGLGCFTSHFYAEKRGHAISDPTKEIMLPRMRLPKFRAGERFKRAVKNPPQGTLIAKDSSIITL